MLANLTKLNNQITYRLCFNAAFSTFTYISFTKPINKLIIDFHSISGSISFYQIARDDVFFFD